MKYLSKILAETGFVVSTAEARRLIMGGIIFVDGKIEKDPMRQLEGTHRLERRGRLQMDEEVIV